MVSDSFHDLKMEVKAALLLSQRYARLSDNEYMLSRQSWQGVCSVSIALRTETTVFWYSTPIFFAIFRPLESDLVPHSKPDSKGT